VSQFAARTHRPLRHVKHSFLAHHSERHCNTYATGPIGPQPLNASGQPSPAPAPLPPAPPAASGT
jgi:hypothetical protein